MAGKLPRSLFRENLNVLIIPESGDQISSFRLPKGLARTVACTMGVVALLLAVSVQVFMESRDRGRMLASVNGENEQLRAELYQLDGEIDVLRESIEMLSEYELRARVMAGLHDGVIVTAAGIGGLEDLPREDGALRPALRNVVIDAEIKLNELIRGAEETRRQYEVTIAKLREQKEDLARIPSIHPLDGTGWYSSGFGHRDDPFTGRRAFHAGLDISAPVGTPIHAAADGVVIQAGWNGAYGKSVKIDHGNGMVSIYAHNSLNIVAKGDEVSRGDVIAKVGSTGRSTGPHLHYGIKVDNKHVNPYNFITPPNVAVD